MHKVYTYADIVNAAHITKTFYVFKHTQPLFLIHRNLYETIDAYLLHGVMNMYQMHVQDPTLAIFVEDENDEDDINSLTALSQ
jgi:hypothetical protein